MDTYLNPRQKKILSYLLTKNDWAKGSEIAMELGVTTRTIRNDIAYINSACGNNEEIICSSNQNGYSLKDYDKAISMAKKHMNHIPIYPDERVNYILKKLIFEKDEIDIYCLADEIIVSESTIENDIKKVESIIEKNSRNVSIVRKGTSISLVGSEKQKRALLSEMLFKETNESFFDISSYKKYFSDIDLYIIQKHITEVVNKYNFVLNDMAVVNIIIHIAIAIDRINNQNILDTSYTSKDIADTTEYKIADELCSKLEREFNIEFPKKEVLYISYLFLGKRINQNICSSRGELEKIVEPYFADITESLLSSINTEYGINFLGDDILFVGLCLHIRVMYDRIKNDVILRNPVLDDLKRRYPFIFEISVFFANEFLKITDLKMNENEIGFIALHLGAAFERSKVKKDDLIRVAIVCSTGYLTSNILLSKVNSLYNQRVDIIGAFSFLEIDKISKYNADFIFTTVPLEYEMPVKIIKISPFIDENDIKIINKELNIYDKEKKTDELQREVSKFLKEELFYKDIIFDDRFQVIDYMAKDIYDKGYVLEDYPQLVLERERISSTSFGNLVAIPHPIRMNAHQTVISIAILDKPIMWGSYKVQLVFMFAIKARDRKKLNNLFGHLIDIIEKPDRVNDLIKSKDFNDFKSKVLEK